MRGSTNANTTAITTTLAAPPSSRFLCLLQPPCGGAEPSGICENLSFEVKLEQVGRKFNCTGQAVQVRRLSVGVFEVRFAGNAAPSALANGVGNAYAVVDPLPGGVFRVAVHPAGRDDPADQPFVIMLV